MRIYFEISLKKEIDDGDGLTMILISFLKP